MPLTFYTDYLSQPARAVGLFMRINNIPFEEKSDILTKGEHKTDEYAKQHYFQAVPCIDDDGFKLTESVAILKYLLATRQVPDHWYPTDAKARARVDQFLSWQHTGIRKGGVGVFVNSIFVPMRTGQPINYAELKGKADDLENALNQMENYFLKDHDYVAGKEISIADLLAICEVMQPASINYDIGKGRPQVSAWVKRVSAKLQPHFDKFNEKLIGFAGKFKDGIDFSKLNA